MLKNTLIILFCLSNLVLAFNSADTLTFQGYLTDARGSPITGRKYMGFKVYGGPTTLTNNLLGGDNHIQGIDGKFSREVTVYNGNYAVKIPLSNSEIVSLNAPEAWIEVYVSDTLPNNPSQLFTTANKMSPRIQLTATPYAMNVRGLKISKPSATYTIEVMGSVSANVVYGAVWN